MLGEAWSGSNIHTFTTVVSLSPRKVGGGPQQYNAPSRYSSSIPGSEAVASVWTSASDACLPLQNMRAEDLRKKPQDPGSASSDRMINLVLGL